MSNTGYIKSVKRNKILKPQLGTNGRVQANLAKNRKYKTVLIANMVYQYFIDSNVNFHKYVIEHKDNDIFNCCIENLYLINKKTSMAKYLRQRKNIRTYQYNGKEYLLNELLKKTRLTQTALLQRLANGWSIQEIVEIPPKCERKKEAQILKTTLYKYKDDLLSIKQIAEKYNVKETTIYMRLYRGWSIEEAIEIPVA